MRHVFIILIDAWKQVNGFNDVIKEFFELVQNK